jgi:IclR family pca regulon transcriptional regulator
VASLDEPARKRFMTRTRLIRLTPRTIVDKAELRAEIERVRAQGYALVDQELELGLRSLAVPVARAGGTTVAAINVGVHAARVDNHALVREFLPVLQQAAAEIAAAISHT